MSEKRETEGGLATPNTASPQAKRTKTDDDLDAASAREHAPATNDAETETDDASAAKESAGSSWKPPSFGHPCWIGIPVHDVARAKAFYEAVFQWKFRTAEDTTQYPENETAMITFEGTSIGGGLIRCEGPLADHASFKPSGGTTIYLWVDDVDETLALAKEKGGEVVVGRKAEGKMGWQGKFKDTEGNFFGVYTAKKPGDKEPEAAAAGDTEVTDAEPATAAAGDAKATDADTDVADAPAAEAESTEVATA